MIDDYFTTQYTVRRASWTTDDSGNSYSTESEVETFYGHTQQARAELIENLGLSFTTSFTVWCPLTTDVKAGDTITDGTTTYSVRAVNRRDYGESRHLELIVEQDEVEADES